MKYQWATATHIGLFRTQNQDAVWPEEPGADEGPLVAAVADGMGGHAGGEVASRLALQAAISRRGSATQRVAAANKAVVEGVIDEPALSGMGTTLTLGIFEPDGRLEVGHVGDSRAYLLHGDEFRRLTTDHTLVAELVESGRLRPDQVESHPQRNLLTRAIGMAQDLNIDTASEELAPGDRVLLCSDGLWNMVGTDDIASILASGPPEEAAWNLVEAANAAGGQDNVTVAIVAALP
jgi:protein phosphatase